MDLQFPPRSGALRQLFSSEFVRQVSETYFTQIFVIALSFVNSIIVTRLLGPEGRGLLAAANTFTGVGVQLTNLGLHSSNTYYVSREPRLLPVLLGNSYIVSAACGVVVLGSYFFIQANPNLAPFTGSLLALASAAIPIGLAYLFLQNLLIGTQRIHTYNVIDLATRVLAVLLVASTAPLGIVSPEAVFGLVLATVLLGLVWATIHLGSVLSEPIRFSPTTLRQGFRYGLRAYFGCLFSFLVLKSDILMVTYMRGYEETGYYAIAVGLADILLIFPTVVGTVLFPRLSAISTVRERWRMTRRILAILAPAVFAALLLALLAARPLIRLAYGEAFDPSYSAVVWLLPGVGFLAVNLVFMNLFASCGMPAIAVYSPLIALVVNVAANLYLVPSIGFVGASISSSIAYGLMLAMSLVYIRFRLLPRADV
jgi:O-antigen/teichoic acid export membrane protein